MSRWTAFLIAAATAAGVFSFSAIVGSVAAAPGAGAHARGPAAGPMSTSARATHRARPPAFAPRWSGRRPGVRGPRHSGSWQGRPVGAHGRHGPWAHGRHGHHGRRTMWGYGAAGFSSVYMATQPVYDTGYAEPPLQWTFAEPDLAPCARPLVIQIGARAYNRPLPQVSYGSAGCGAPRFVRYVAGPRVVDVGGEPPARGRASRQRR